MMFRILLFSFSLGVVALGQPAWYGVLGACSALIGYAIFFQSLPSSLSAHRRFWLGTGWFSGVQLIQLSWMSSIEFQGYYIVFIYLLCSMIMGLQFGWLTCLVPAMGILSWGRILCLSAFWALSEWIRLFPLCGFSWNPIGLAMTYFLPSLQLASLIGVHGMSFVVIAINLLGLNCMRRCNVQHLSAFASVAAFPYLYGLIRLSMEALPSFGSIPSDCLHVALVQTHLLPSQKNLYPSRKQEWMSALEQWEHLVKLVHAHLKQEERPVDLIVFPEGAVPYHADFTCFSQEEVCRFFIETYGAAVQQHFPPLSLPYARMRATPQGLCWQVTHLFWCQTLANLYNAGLIIGLDHLDRTNGRNFNSAFYFKGGGTQIQRYDKQVLLPLAEALPCEWMRVLANCYGIHEFFVPGKAACCFDHRYAPSICYEETFPEVMRAAKAIGASLFVNLTNDNYYPTTRLHSQHLYHARLRAVENGVPLVRSCNGGVTAVIDHHGKILSQFAYQLREEGVLCAAVPMQTSSTPFSWLGEGGVMTMCLGICLVGIRYSRS